jgi:hypothetical protein
MQLSGSLSTQHNINKRIINIISYIKKEIIMSHNKLFQPRILTAIALILLLTVVAFGYAAANIVPETGAGDGTGIISGYTVTNINYSLLTTDPSKIDGLTMDIAATSGAGVASDVRVTVDGGTTWVTCSGPVTSTWTCAFSPEANVSTMAALQVVAVE